MSYRDKFEQADRESFSASIARDILERMDKLRLNADENAKRRWIWELIQNAKDVSQDGLPVEIRVNIANDKLIFSHNGKCFTADDITFLIRQVSNKDRKSDEQQTGTKQTGKFGTGFLTTHLLSEQVVICGVAKEPDLDYRQFELPLDRSGRTKDEIVQSVQRSIDVRDKLDEASVYVNFDNKAFNTSFTYNLDEEGKRVAEIGIADLERSFPYTLAFSSQIKSLCIANENRSYELSATENLTDIVECCTIHASNNGVGTERKIIKLSANGVSIAVEIEQKDGRTFVKGFDEYLPKLFCDFPLIGTRDFYLPFIVNASDFNPTEPRDGIWLTDKDSEPKVEQNKKLMLEARHLYGKLLAYAIEQKWGNLYNLANTKTPAAKSWFSEDWVKANMQKPIRDALLKQPIVELENGEVVPIKNADNKDNIHFPSHLKDEVRAKIWDMEYKLFPTKIPAKKDVDNWYEVIWNDCFKGTLKTITEFVADKKSIAKLAEHLENDRDKAIAWFNEYYDLLNFEATLNSNPFIKEIIDDKYAVIPNQNGYFKKRTELQIDDNIEEELKKVLVILGSDPKNYLRLKGINTASQYTEEKEKQLLFPTKKQDAIIEVINKIFETNNNNNIGAAIYYLASLFCEKEDFPSYRQQIYEYCQKLIPDVVQDKKEISLWSKDIWKNVDVPLIRKFVKVIGEQTNLKTLRNKLSFNTEQETIDWLNGFIQFLKERGLSDQLNLKTNPVLPNQKGEFCPKEELTTDCGKIDEQLKTILTDLGYDIRKELIENRIFIELPKTAERKASFVASEIITRITPKFSELSRTEKTRKVFKALYIWFSKNKELAKTLFGDLYVNKHKLYDDEEIAENMEKATVVDEYFGERFSPDELREKLNNLQLPVKETPTEIIDIVKGLEIKLSDIEMQNMVDAVISTEYDDGISTKEKIEASYEAKQIVRERLQAEGFDFSQGINGYSTVDGVMKDGKEYPLVVKSYKWENVPFKVGANEWIQLFKPNSMFWVHFGNRNLGCLKFHDLIMLQDKLSISFSTENLNVPDRINKFAAILHYFKQVHFDFSNLNPNNYRADDLEDYRFDTHRTETDINDNENDLQ
jgi:hypothetical protein